ncbi:MAG: hypothetical protein ACFFBD_29600, partial [Candidatus Hodarchaeota archaeon]
FKISSQYAYENSTNFRVAYGTINENYQPDQAVLVQFPRTYYFLENMTIINLENQQTFSYDRFREIIQQYGSGWVVWETNKLYHIKSSIRDYAKNHLTKHHGTGIDNTGIEVYSWGITIT